MAYNNNVKTFGDADKSAFVYDDEDSDEDILDPQSIGESLDVDGFSSDDVENADLEKFLENLTFESEDLDDSQAIDLNDSAPIDLNDSAQVSAESDRLSKISSVTLPKINPDIHKEMGGVPPGSLSRLAERLDALDQRVTLDAARARASEQPKYDKLLKGVMYASILSVTAAVAFTYLNSIPSESKSQKENRSSSTNVAPVVSSEQIPADFTTPIIVPVEPVAVVHSGVEANSDPSTIAPVVSASAPPVIQPHQPLVRVEPKSLEEYLTSLDSSSDLTQRRTYLDMARDLPTLSNTEKLIVYLSELQSYRAGRTPYDESFSSGFPEYINERVRELFSQFNDLPEAEVTSSVDGILPAFSRFNVTQSRCENRLVIRFGESLEAVLFRFGPNGVASMEMVSNYVVNDLLTPTPLPAAPEPVVTLPAAPIPPRRQENTDPQYLQSQREYQREEAQIRRLYGSDEARMNRNLELLKRRYSHLFSE